MQVKAAEILRILSVLYPDPKSELHFNNDFELICAVLLSAQCTDKKVNEVTPALFLRFPTLKLLAEAQVSEVEEIIKQVNYYKTKARHLVMLAQKVNQEFNGKIPRTHDELTSLPGVGRKTANVVLGELGVEPRLAVDTHVYRVSRRLGLTRGANVRKVEESLTKQFPPETWRPLHHGLILHGRRVCKAQSPMCEICPLIKICNFGRSKINK